MNNLALVAQAKNIQKNFKTTYMWGTFGSIVSATLIYNKTKQYPQWYNDTRVAKLKKFIGTKTWAFDCVGLIKAILWGWSGKQMKDYGGATYSSNGVPDLGADQMISCCKDVSKNFEDIVIGEVVWKSGHIGIYIGEGLVIESTPAWKSGVQISTFRDVPGYNSRKWTKHGKLPWVEYVAEEVEEEVEVKPTEIKVDGKTHKPNCVNVDGSIYIKARDVATIFGYDITAKGATPVFTKK